MPIPAVAAESTAPTPPADARVSSTGLTSQVLRAGSGDQRATLQDKVRVHFGAWNTSGKLVDGSEQRGGPVVFDVSGVIAGWTEALQEMQVGERRRLWIPDHLTYPGRPGYPRPPALFEIELLEIIAGAAPEPAPADLTAPPRAAIKTKSGLVYKRLQHDAARATERPNAWDHVLLQYAGWDQSGAMFSSSRRQAARFDLQKVMPGWREALPLMSVGDKARLWIPEALTYQGRVGEPRGTLVYDVELLSIERKPEPPRAPLDVRAPPARASRTASGLAYRFLHKSGSDKRPGPHDKVSVHYSAWTTDGKLFDSSVVRGKPAHVPLDRLISGWSEGLQLMAEGDKALLWIPEALAYAGRDGSPRGMLVYEVELLQLMAASAVPQND
jgi:FKBP-type peptidyl-prolyl cis-trans isomerase